MTTLATLIVLCTVSTTEALRELVPQFEHETGQRIDITYQPAPELIARIKAGLRADIFIGPEEYSGPLADDGILVGASRTAFARSTTGLAVRAGAPRPDIGTPESLKQALLTARSIAFSEGASGIVFANVIERLGIADAVRAKRASGAPSESIGAIVARGDAQIGIQQISALMPVAGIDIVGTLPEAFQQPIIYGTNEFAAPTVRSPEKLAAIRAFTSYLRSPAAHSVLRRKGLEPA